MVYEVVCVGVCRDIFFGLYMALRIDLWVVLRMALRRFPNCCVHRSANGCAKFLRRRGTQWKDGHMEIGTIIQVEQGERGGGLVLRVG